MIKARVAASPIPAPLVTATWRATALDFYVEVFGGQVTAFTFAQGGGERDSADGAVAEQLIWGGVQAPDRFSIMASDVAEITACWNGLVEGGTVRADLGPAGFSPLYGMVRDRFGVTWVLDVVAPYNG